MAWRRVRILLPFDKVRYTSVPIQPPELVPAVAPLVGVNVSIRARNANHNLLREFNVEVCASSPAGEDAVVADSERELGIDIPRDSEIMSGAVFAGLVVVGHFGEAQRWIRIEARDQIDDGRLSSLGAHP